MNPPILFEDEHLLAVNKPSGINTHKPDRFAPDGIHEWLSKREPRWSNLSVLHRLDKETSGVMLFGKSKQANRSLTQQFESHKIEKTYVLLAANGPPRSPLQVRWHDAVTEFALIQRRGRTVLVQARPISGKTHQIRRHAAENGFPILGDTRYGGARASRLMLHARQIAFQHPVTQQRVRLEAPLPAAFGSDDPLVAAREFRQALFGEDTNAYRLISGHADGFAGLVVDSYAGHLLAQWQTEHINRSLYDRLGARTIHEQIITKRQRTTPVGPALERFLIRENGLHFLVSFGEGFGTGIFLDQRENRRRLLRMNLAGKTALNCFAHTCAFSVAAAKAGATVTSVDVSRKYLDWGAENFRANGLDAGQHDFVCGEVFAWLSKFTRRRQRWDVVIVDPPTFSTTKKGRVFRAARDYLELAALAMALVAPGGWLFCSTNQRTIAAEKFEATIRQAARSAGRVIEAMEFETAPFDFRLAAGQRPYLKTFWVRLE